MSSGLHNYIGSILRNHFQWLCWSLLNWSSINSFWIGSNGVNLWHWQSIVSISVLNGNKFTNNYQLSTTTPILIGRVYHWSCLYLQFSIRFIHDREHDNKEAPTDQIRSVLFVFPSLSVYFGPFYPMLSWSSEMFNTISEPCLLWWDHKFIGNCRHYLNNDTSLATDRSSV